MNDLERFQAIAHFEKPDYVPIFGIPGAPGMSGAGMESTRRRLIATGMPPEVGAPGDGQETWHKYWGTTGPVGVGFSVSSGAEGFRSTTRIDDGFEIVESENGAVTRQVVNNNDTYSMPEFIRYPVRDRASWEFYRERMTPREFMPRNERDAHCERMERRSRPLMVHAGGTYGRARLLMGPEAVSLALYEDPQLVHDIILWHLEQTRRDVIPLIERLKPEIVHLWEDLDYNHGMLLSPPLFEEFCGEYYREVCDCARANGADVVVVDSDGNAMQFTGVLESLGANGLLPYEVKAGNDLFALREQHQSFVFFGWLEKEIINEGNEDCIEPEILGKVPALLEKGGYFPNGDHGIQPTVTFPNLCRFMTVLHEVCDNPEGEFPRGTVSAKGTRA